MGVQVEFDYGSWTARYPEFANVPAALASLYFAEAGLYHNNTGAGLVSDAGQQSLFMNMLTAHIAEIFRLTGNNHAVSQMVGRISSASQGTVSVQSEFDVPAGTPQWYAQTKYGAAYWVATAAFRTMQYIPGPRRVFAPLYAGRPIY